MVEKPLTVLCAEFSANLEKVINDSPLPACAKLPVIRYITLQLEDIERRQYQADVDDYAKRQEAENAAAEEVGEAAQEPPAEDEGKEVNGNEP